MKSQKWKDLMAFSAREKRGISVLVIIVLMLITLRVWEPWNNKKRDVYDFSEYEAEIDRFEVNLQEGDDNKMNTSDFNASYEKQSPDFNKKMFSFNPNTVSKDQLLELGFNDKLAKNIINYRNAGGGFYETEDLKKIYGMTEKFYAHVEPYIVIKKDTSKGKNEVFDFNPNSISLDSLRLLGFDDDVSDRWIKYREASGGFDDLDGIKKLYGINIDLLEKLEPHMQFPADDHEDEKPAKKLSPVHINKADADDLVEREAVNRGLAKRIMAYRNLLGGFHDLQQLNEVYGISKTEFDNLKTRVIIDKDNIQTIDLNEVTFKELLRHPYMTKSDVKKIMKYRDFEGKIEGVDELLKNNILTDSTCQKMIPYIHLPKKTKNKVQNPK
ncbi:MAG: helix-hairpin-helix domain-containing protein [Bacteroidales bacterium]